MLAQRVRSILIIAPIPILALVGGIFWIALLVAALTVAAAVETFRLLRNAGQPTVPLLGVAGALAIALSIEAPSLIGDRVGALVRVGDRAILVVALVTVLLAVGAFARHDPRDGFAAWAMSVFGATYASLLGFVTALGQVGPPLAAGAALEPIGAARAWIILLVAAVWSYDSGAYLFGKRFGRARFLTHLSPSKTYAGLIGGLLAATLSVAIVMWAMGRSPIEAIVLGPLLGLAAQAGDLAESMLKRAAGVKDSGNLIPGHGGILDRVDSFLFAAPVAVLYVVVVGG